MVIHIPTVEGITSFGDYSPVSIGDGIVSVAGQFGADADDPAGQVRGAFANVGKALGAAGLGFDDVIKFTTFVVGRETIPHFMATRKEVFAEIYPGACAVVASGTPEQIGTDARVREIYLGGTEETDAA